MKTFWKVLGFNLVVIGFFLYVANIIPQQRKDAPKELELSADMTTAEFVTIGQEIFYGKGTCALCHTIGEKGERCPNLAGVGARAETRLGEARYQESAGSASNGAEYLVESLMQPGVYVVEKYQPSMPPMGRQLNDLEMVAVVSFLQSLEGEVSVDGHSRFPKYRGGSATVVAAAAPAATPTLAASGQSGEELVQQWACHTCHKFDAPDRLVGPSLWDVGARQNADYIRESILQPDAKIAAGFPQQVMKSTLDGLGFYQKVALQDLNTLVAYLTSLKGAE